MKALLKIEWIKRGEVGQSLSWESGYLSDFSSFFLVSSQHLLQKLQEFLLYYMLTMTGFSMSSFGLFTFPYMLQEDRIEHWLTYIEHSKG